MRPVMARTLVSCPPRHSLKPDKPEPREIRTKCVTFIYIFNIVTRTGYLLSAKLWKDAVHTRSFKLS